MSYGIRRIDFYRSKAWDDVRKSVWIKQHCLCARCYKPVYVYGISKPTPKNKQVKGIVHHKIHLDNNNVYDDNIAFNEDNLEGLCIDCHNKEHNKGTATREEYTFDSNGNLINIPYKVQS